MALLRFILFFVIASAVWRFVKPLFFTKNSNSQGRSQSGSQGPRVTSTGDDKSFIPENEGDYIDFEEVK